MGVSTYMGQFTIRCPNCKRPLVVARSDSLHQSWSFEKPQEIDTVKQDFECKILNGNSRFTIHWYESKMLLERRLGSSNTLFFVQKFEKQKRWGEKLF